jgi:hypothetical protein
MSKYNEMSVGRGKVPLLGLHINGDKFIRGPAIDAYL